ncbi:GNAT family N-acetyltransferase [Candidatus Poribacteria bacterium]|nr:GNAT family N-acetyltransferase [Candidatus Poribacteria bacterium]
MKEKYHIRHANASDLNRVGEIARQAWERIHESYRKIIGEEMHRDLCANWEEEKESQVRRHWREHPDWFRVVESIETGQVVGFITFRIDDAKSMGTIGNNAVALEAQGKGLGTLMYNYVLDLFREHELKYASVTTGLDEGHAPARRAYEKAGFHITRADVTYYKYLNE